MKSLGIVRKIDQVGRIVLPRELRTIFQLEDSKDSVEIFVEDDKIILKKFEANCIFCNSANDVITFKNKKVCKECIEKMASAE